MLFWNKILPSVYYISHALIITYKKKSTWAIDWVANYAALDGRYKKGQYIDNRAKRASISVCCNPLFYEELALTTRSKDEIRQHIYNKKRSIIGLRDRPQPTPASPPRLGGQSETNSSWHSSTLNKAVLHRDLKYIQKWKNFVEITFQTIVKVLKIN